MPDPFISPADVVEYLGRGGTADPGIIIACDAACDIARRLADQEFNANTATVTLDGTGTDYLLLPQHPVRAVSKVVVNGGTITDYALSAVGGLVRKSASTYSSHFSTLIWPSGRQNVEVTFDYGYADEDIPRDVRMVALTIASRLVIQGPALYETVGQTSVRYAAESTAVMPTEKLILSKYRRVRSA